MSQMILQKWAAEQSRLYCFTIWRRDKQFYHLGTWTHYDLFFSSVLPSSQVLSIHAYLLLPEVLRKFIFPIVYSWIRSWGNGTGWELSYGMNGVYTFRTVKDTKDRKKWEAVPKPKNTDTLGTEHLSVSCVLDRILIEKGERDTVGIVWNLDRVCELGGNSVWILVSWLGGLHDSVWGSDLALSRCQWLYFWIIECHVRKKKW